MQCQAMRTNYVSRSPTKDEESFLRRALASHTHSSHSTPLPESLHTPSPVGRLLGVDGRTSTVTVWLVLVGLGDISGEEDTLACATSMQR